MSGGDGWVQNVVRPMMSEDDGEVSCLRASVREAVRHTYKVLCSPLLPHPRGHKRKRGQVKSSLFDQIFPVLFFISYYIIILVVLFNIVVAILLGMCWSS